MSSSRETSIIQDFCVLESIFAGFNSFLFFESSFVDGVTLSVYKKSPNALGRYKGGKLVVYITAIRA